MAELPVDVGAVNATLACAAPAVATTLVGAPGAVVVVPELAVMLYFCSRVVPLVGVAVGQTPDVAAERWMKPSYVPAAVAVRPSTTLWPLVTKTGAVLAVAAPSM
jgi:hypothetical protein